MPSLRRTAVDKLSLPFPLHINANSLKKIYSLLLLAIQLALFIYGLFAFVASTYFFMGIALILYLMFSVFVSFLLWGILLVISHLLKLKDPSNFFLLRGTMIMWIGVITIICIATTLWFKGIEDDQNALSEKIKASEKSRLFNALAGVEAYRFLAYDEVRSDWMIQNAADDTLFANVHTTQDIGIRKFDVLNLKKKDTVGIIEYAFEIVAPFMNQDSIDALKDHLRKGSYCVRQEKRKTLEITIPCSDYPYSQFSMILYYEPYAFRRKKGMVMSVNLSAASR